MNDFTKEELEGLKNVLLQSREDYPAMHQDAECTALLHKLQSMIDNYRVPNCIHEIDRVAKKCKLCGLSSSSIPCVGGWL